MSRFQDGDDMKRPDRQRGIALMLVMWVLTLLTIMALGMTATQRTETALTENAVATARFRALADAAIAYAALSFMSRPSSTETEDQQDSSSVWLPNGAPKSWNFDGQMLILRVSNESSRINLNNAQPDLLRSLMEVVGVPEEEATSIADAIADWRDLDGLAQLNGAEDDDYENAGLPLGAKDAPFDSVEELRQVMGMTEAIYRRLAPELTVTTNGTVDEAFASPAVWATLRGISLEEAIEDVAERDQSTVPGATTPTTRNRGGPAYRIRVEDGAGDGRGHAMEAVFELDPGRDPPYFIDWRRYGVTHSAPIAVPSDDD